MHVGIVAQLATEVKGLEEAFLRNSLTTFGGAVGLIPAMSKSHKQKTPAPPQIYAGRQPNRPHYIEAWAEHRGFMNQAALVKATGADKSVVSRWYEGTSPAREWQLKLCELFGYPGEPEILFRHPDDDWMSRFFKDRTADERTRARTLLETAFPPKRA